MTIAIAIAIYLCIAAILGIAASNFIYAVAVIPAFVGYSSHELAWYVTAQLTGIILLPVTSKIGDINYRLCGIIDAIVTGRSTFELMVSASEIADLKDFDPLRHSHSRR